MTGEGISVTATTTLPAAHRPGIDYWAFSWRKGGGAAGMIDISRRERFCQQEYRGRVFSLRHADAYRVSQGRPAIGISTLYYGKPDGDTPGLLRTFRSRLLVTR